MSNFDLLKGLEASYTLPSLSADGPSSAGISDYDREPLMLSIEIEGSQAGEVRDQLLAAIELAQAMQPKPIDSAPIEGNFLARCDRTGLWWPAYLFVDKMGVRHAFKANSQEAVFADCWMPLPPVQEGE